MKGKKKVIKNKYHSILSVFAKISRKLSFSTKKIILLESHPDYSDNTFALFEKMLEKNIDEEYKIVWMLHSYSNEKEFGNNIKNNYIHPHKLKDRILNKYYRFFAKYIIYCNEEVEKLNSSSIAINLTHGIYFKAAAAAYRFIDWVIYNTTFGDKEIQEHFKVSKDKIKYLGFPRNDYLFKGNRSAQEYFDLQGKKLIIWMPTFRQTHDRIDADVDMSYGIPIIKDEKEFAHINDALKENNTFLVIKPHPLQTIEKTLLGKYENIIIFDYKKNQNDNIQLYELLGGSDALITDYSSVYFDYLITGNLIGITVDDIEKYKKGIGFIVENPSDILKGFKIKNTDDIIKFINTLNSSEKELYIKKQDAVNRAINIHRDDNSSERVFNFIFGEKDE